MKKIFFVFCIVLLAGFVSATKITLNQYGPDIGNQYMYYHPYPLNTVEVDYDSAANYFEGVLNASGLKPNFTYQIKMLGKPLCMYNNGNDLINEKIGFMGRWTCVKTLTNNCNNCVGADCNRDDNDYNDNKLKFGSSKECLQSYLVFGYFTADNNGNVDAKNFVADTSYRVLRCDGIACGAGNDDFLQVMSSNGYSGWLCPYDKVGGELEPDRGGCNGLDFDIGNYNVVLAITEESFHKGPGSWATVLMNENVPFAIVGNGGSGGGSGGSGNLDPNFDLGAVPEFSAVAALFAFSVCAFVFFLLRKH